MIEPKTYFVKLTPRQLFFFGGEQGETADYFLKGNSLPQQTALMGLVRHQILLQNNLMDNNRIKNDVDAADWIGLKSFEWDNKTILFNKIFNISPCYLVSESEGNRTLLLPYCQAYCNYLKKLSDNYYLPSYDPKIQYSDVWMPLDKSNPIKLDDIITEVIKPGVDKNYTGKTEEDDKAYFKQVWLKLKKGYSFGFYITLDPEVNFQTAEVNFGKENSAFKMEVSNSPLKNFSNETNPTALLLTSDTYVEENIIAKADFAVINTIPFRNITSSTTNKTNYYQIDKTGAGTNNRKSSVRLLLLKRGSIFYGKNGKIASIIKAIDEQKHFKNIGYNHYHLLNITY